jgi:hypothetical protein
MQQFRLFRGKSGCFFVEDKDHVQASRYRLMFRQSMI